MFSFVVFCAFLLCLADSRARVARSCFAHVSLPRRFFAEQRSKTGFWHGTSLATLLCPCAFCMLLCISRLFAQHRQHDIAGLFAVGSLA